MRGGMPQGQLSFLLKAGSDTLPTPLNLKRMRIQCDSFCRLCKNPRPTTSHILNGCLEALVQSRYTWRHDSVLMSPEGSFNALLPPSSILIFADLDGFRYDNSPPSTIPSTILVTPLRPDIVLVSNNDKQITILELTVPTNTSQGIEQARLRKQTKSEYISRIEDICMREWSVYYDTIEIGSLGHFTKDTIEAVKSVLPSVLTNSKLASTQAKNLLLSASRI